MRSKSKQKGAAFVELLLVTLFVMIPLLIGTVELGTAFVHYNSLTKNVRDGGRYLAANAYDTDNTVDFSRILGGHLNSVGTEAVNLVTHGNTNGTGSLLLSFVDSATVTIANDPDADHVRVTVEAPYNKILGGSLITLRATTVMRVHK